MKKPEVYRQIARYLIVVILFTASATTAMAEVIVIVNPGVPVESIDRNTLRDIYLGKKTTWSKDLRIASTVLKSGPVNDEFLKKYLDKTAAQFQSYWNKLLFTGTGVPPKPFGSEQELVDYVARTNGAIGYVGATFPYKGVKVLKIQ